jgi:hypothetical protein
MPLQTHGTVVKFGIDRLDHATVTPLGVLMRKLSGKPHTIRGELTLASLLRTPFESWLLGDDATITASSVLLLTM